MFDWCDLHPENLNNLWRERKNETHVRWSLLCGTHTRCHTSLLAPTDLLDSMRERERERCHCCFSDNFLFITMSRNGVGGIQNFGAHLVRTRFHRKCFRFYPFWWISLSGNAQENNKKKVNVVRRSPCMFSAIFFHLDGNTSSIDLLETIKLIERRKTIRPWMFPKHPLENPFWGLDMETIEPWLGPNFPMELKLKAFIGVPLSLIIWAIWHHVHH